MHSPTPLRKKMYCDESDCEMTGQKGHSEFMFMLHVQWKVVNSASRPTMQFRRNVFLHVLYDGILFKKCGQVSSISASQRRFNKIS